MNATYCELELREVSGDEMYTVEGGSFIPGLNPVVLLATKETTAPRLIAQPTAAIRSD
jgi:hypothetical protein